MQTLEYLIIVQVSNNRVDIRLICDLVVFNNRVDCRIIRGKLLATRLLDTLEYVRLIAEKSMTVSLVE